MVYGVLLKYWFASILLAFAFSLTSVAHSATHEVIVDKTSRKLWVVVDQRVEAEFPISLGSNPVGHKQSLGDGRTPEGQYTLTWKSDESQYYKAFHIDYPNQADQSSASDRGVHPGGNIKVHGLPNRTPYDAQDYLAFDWTNGCIAVSNDAMDQIWDLVPTGTSIYIYANLFGS